VLAATADPAVIGRVLDFLRQRIGAAPARIVARASPVTVAEAVDQYGRGAMRLLARGSQYTYGTWIKQLVDRYGERTPASISAGDLTDLIAEHVLARREEDERRRSGRSAEENAVGAYRHLWTYLVETGHVTDNVAQQLRKPARVDPRRRGFLPEEAALLRLLTRSGQDPLLDELTLSLPERLGLRRIELCRLRISDIRFAERTLEVWGKGDKYRTMPIRPALYELIEIYLEDRRPATCQPRSGTRAKRCSCAARPPAPSRSAGPPAVGGSRSCSSGCRATRRTSSAAATCRCTRTGTHTADDHDRLEQEVATRLR
jgi:integrase